MTFLLVAIIIVGSLESSDTSLPDSTQSDSLQKKNVRLMVLPIVFSSPDTRLAGGVLPQVIFRTSSTEKPSSVRMDAYYTLNRQYHILLRPVLWLRNGIMNISGSLSFKEWPTSFYGIGNNSSGDDQEKFTETLYEGSVQGTVHIGSNYYLGVSYSFRRSEVDAQEETGFLASNQLAGSGTSTVSSAGLVLRHDSRDNQFYPSSGSYHTLELTSAQKILGSDFSFSRYTLDMRKYFPIKNSQVLAVQGMVSLSSGTVPFRVLPGIGDRLRGYSSVRYIDRHLAAFQLEYRVAPLIGRLGFVAFAGAGDVFHHANDLQLDRLKYSAGIGIRYLFDRAEKINIRLDYGIGKDSSGDYIDLNEAF
ncbi:BamA/TamA family outer membrane protein [Balneolaceae bacterium YR4-1]|uniref:BamA/TamA family outer membrane protein n=1 Tax=Halalkalibaculum roseum TaxID=2709311 RepID=A0A6M1SYW5_9BACT|nr:BamA/TamA family outer membrane protein [Halalkalibaculum roseum]NGP75757.1 BamA/TamA family outer membrane protein [Halalkalibaculum roseum]